MLKDVNVKNIVMIRGLLQKSGSLQVSTLLTVIFEGFTFICPKICQDVLFIQAHILMFWGILKKKEKKSFKISNSPRSHLTSHVHLIWFSYVIVIAYRVLWGINTNDLQNNQLIIFIYISYKRGFFLFSCSHMLFGTLNSACNYFCLSILFVRIKINNKRGVAPQTVPSFKKQMKSNCVQGFYNNSMHQNLLMQCTNGYRHCCSPDWFQYFSLYQSSLDLKHSRL